MCENRVSIYFITVGYIFYLNYITILILITNYVFQDLIKWKVYIVSDIL